MKITRENYERYFIDYLDGMLTDAGKEEILVFLGENPDLAAELQNLGKMILIPAEEIFPDKPGIKKSLISLMSEKGLTFDELCAASMEGDLHENENEILFGFLDIDEAHRKEFALLKKTVLKVDKTVSYPGKKILRRATIFQKNRQLFIAVVLAAAVILALLIVIRPVEDQSEQVIVVKDQTVQEEVKSLERIISTDILKMKPSKENTGIDPGTDQQSLTHPVTLPDDFEKEQIILAEVHAKNAELLGITDNRHDFIPQRYYTRSKASTDDYLEPGELLTSLFREKVLKQQQPLSESRISLWELADAGMQGLSNFATGNFYIDRSYDADGRINHLTLETPVFGFSTPVSSKNNPE
jgi:hypothetical protein